MQLLTDLNAVLLAFGAAGALVLLLRDAQTEQPGESATLIPIPVRERDTLR